MRTFYRTIIILFLLSLTLPIPVLATGDQTGKNDDVDWADPESIDPYKEDIGDFLDADVSEFAKKANEEYKAGNFEEAAKYYLATVRYDINDGGSIYNLACCYGLLGKAELAAKYVERAVKAGFENIGHIRWDPDFDDVREEAVFDETVDRLASIVEEKEKELGDVIYFDSPSFFKCRIHFPEGYNPERSYPLIVGLHGYGSNTDRFITLWKRFANRDFIYVTPQAPYPFSVGKHIGYSWAMGVPGHRLLSQRAMTMSENYIAGVIRNMNKRYNIGDIYLMGFSQGCAFTYIAGIKNHELFKGLICFGGWLDTDWLSGESIKAANGLKIFIAHGTEDRMVEYETGIKARDELEKYGYDVTFHEFDGAHSVPEEALQAAEEWMNE